MSEFPPALGKTIIASAICVFASVWVLLDATHFANAFTTETIRRAEIQTSPKKIQGFNVVSSKGEIKELSQILAEQKRVWIIDFVYTRCNSICLSLGSSFQQLQALIISKGISEKIGLLSISFDTENETLASLENYQKRYSMNADVWQIVTLQNVNDRQRLLDTFGIMVIKAPYGEFEHNAALHLVDGQGVLFQILNFDAVTGAMEMASRGLE